ncbi:MAG: 50S ribosomal protein L15 [Planctomycetia bacterium]|nr:50S ribosomal protein L15 [Planctomycetia bacterium]
MNLHDVNTGIKKNKKSLRLGRGKGTGQGKTAGRGHKGYGSRSGSSMNVSFEGGQMPLFRRIPKRGFNNPLADRVASINLGKIDAFFEDGEVVSPATLKEKGLIKFRYDVLKILGDGELTKKVKIQAHRCSKSAAEKIAASGSELELLPGKAPVVKFQKKVKA